MKILSLLAASLFAFAQQGPIITGGFQTGTAPAVLILLNDSHLSDAQLGDVANALEGKLLGVRIATRLQGQSFCQQGEWCLDVTDAMVGSVSDVAAGALVGQAITREIVAKGVGR